MSIVDIEQAQRVKNFLAIFARIKATLSWFRNFHWNHFMQRAFPSISLIAGLLILSGGCTNPVSPVNNQVSHTFTSGDFGYTLNGTAFDRASSGEVTEASAQIDSNWGLGVMPGSWLLTVNLMDEQISLTSFHTKSIELFVPFTSPVPGTYQITQWNAPAGAQAAVMIDSFQYDSRNGGTLTITKFDTVNNLVSGTFSFTASLAQPSSNPSLVETVTNGSFNNVGIYIGGYGQGTITANVDSVPFTTHSYSRQPLSAFIANGSNELTIEAFNSTVTQTIVLSIDNPGVGTFDLTKNINPFGSPSYSGPNNVSVNGQTGASGTITISQFDTVMHRMSGTFQFSGPDPSTGQTIQITNGVIDSVQWFVL
jgi:Family of unknown function (DUF6252)